jgi:hypothetical protein
MFPPKPPPIAVYPNPVEFEPAVPLLLVAPPAPPPPIVIEYPVPGLTK